MIAGMTLARVDVPHAAAGCVGLHGLKRRWIAGTVRDGLRRGSAAWFTVDVCSQGDERYATLAACVYHAIGRTAVAQLSAQTAPGSYCALFEPHPDRLPAVLAFPDEPSGQEAWRRYLWVGPPAPAVTAPCTKVERAGRSTGPWCCPRLFVPGFAELALIERRLDRCPLATGDTRLARALDDDSPVATVDTKLARFCGAVADLAEASLFPYRGRAGQGH